MQTLLAYCCEWLVFEECQDERMTTLHVIAISQKILVETIFVALVVGRSRACHGQTSAAKTIAIVAGIVCGFKKLDWSTGCCAYVSGCKLHTAANALGCLVTSDKSLNVISTRLEQ